MQSYKRKTFPCINYLQLIDSCQRVVTRSTCIARLSVKAAWQVAAYERLPNVCVWYSRRARLGVLRFVDCWFKLKYVVEETQKFVSICKFEDSTTQETVGEKVSKTFNQNWADALAASDKGSCFKQEKLLTLDEEPVWHSLSITSLALSPFEAVTIINIST